MVRQKRRRLPILLNERGGEGNSHCPRPSEKKKGRSLIRRRGLSLELGKGKGVKGTTLFIGILREIYFPVFLHYRGGFSLEKPFSSPAPEKGKPNM